MKSKSSLIGLFVLVTGLVTSVVLVQKPPPMLSRAFSDPVLFTFSTTSVKVEPSTSFIVDVNANPQGNIVSLVEFKVEYNPQYLSLGLSDVTPGTFLPVKLGQVTIDQISSSKNVMTIVLEASCSSGGCAPAVNTGKLASLKFGTRTQLGSTQVAVSSLTKVASATETSLSAGSVDISSTPVSVSIGSLTTPTSQPTASPVPVPTTTPSPGPTLPPIDGDVKLKPVEDTHVKEAYPSNNYGDDGGLVASNYEESSRQLAFLKFDLRGISGTISSAQLRLTPRLQRDVTKTVNLVTTSSWSEGSVTWSNKPSAGSRIGYFAGAVTPGTPILLDLNAGELNAYIGKLMSIRLGNDTDDNNTLSIYSSETNEYAPELILNLQSGGGTTPTEGYTLTVKDDAYVQSTSSRADNNYGSQTNLIASSYYDDNTRIAYIKFDGSQIAGKTIDSAKLVLTPSLSRKVEKEVRSVSDNSWSEGNLTFLNKPSTGNVLGKVSSLDKELSVNESITINLNASAIVKGSNGDISVAIVNTSTDNTLEVHSKESDTSSYRPRLIIEAH